MRGPLIPARIKLVRTAFLVLVALVVAASAIGCFNASCKAQEVRGANMRCGGGARGFLWTGTGCIYTAACNCTGRDCQSLYATQDSCETAHIHCR